MPSNEDIIKYLREYSQSNIFEKQSEGGNRYDLYRTTWEDRARRSGRALSTFTIREIQRVAQDRFGADKVKKERPVIPNCRLAFDLWNEEQQTAFEICLSSIKNEFHKDVLKGLLAKDAKELIILYCDYRYLSDGEYRYRGRRFLGQASVTEIVRLAKERGLTVTCLLLVPD